MKRINFPLLLGGIILVVLLLLTYFPEQFTSRDPIHEEPPRYIEYQVEGEMVKELSVNPMRPNTINLMGTDDAGRDIYARLVYGTKNTMRLAFLIALFRMMLALPLGILAGMGHKGLSKIIGFFTTFFSAVPMLIFAYVLLNFNYFYRMQMEKSIVAFAVVLALVGWSKLAGILEDHTKRIMEEDFIEGELAIGKTKRQIMTQNVLPHLIPHGVSQFFKEMAMGLFLVAQLAVLYVFVGTTREVGAMAFRANYRMGLEPEWGGMLSRISGDVMRFEEVWWVSLFPVLFFAVAVMGINLLGEGLRLEFQRRTSRVISLIRKTIMMLSPKLFYLQVKSIKTYYKPVLFKVGSLVLLLLYFFMPRYGSAVPFQEEEAYTHLAALTDPSFQGRASGTLGGYEAGEYLIEELTAYGYEISVVEIPYYEGEQAKENLRIMAPMIIEEGEILLTTKDGEKRSFQLHEDFTIFSVNREALLAETGERFTYKGRTVRGGEVSSVSEDLEIFPVEEVYIRSLLSARGAPFSEENMKGVNVYGQEEKRPFSLQFMLLDEYEAKSNAYLHKTHTILPFKELRELLYEGDYDLEISFQIPQLPEQNGRIIEGFLPGEGFTKERPGETIIIGAAYDGVYEKESISIMPATPAAMALQVAKQVATLEEPLSRSLNFVFWDNQMEIKKNTREEGSEYYHRELMKPIDWVVSGGYYYYEMAFPGLSKQKELNLITFPAQGGRKPSYLIGRQMEQLLKDMKDPYRRFQSVYGGTNTSSSLGIYDMVTRSQLDMRLNAFFTVGIGNAHVQDMATEKDHMDNLDKDMFRRIGQVMIDNLTMNEYLMEDPQGKEGQK